MADANIKAVITAEDRASATLNNFGKKAGSLGSKLGKTLKYGAIAAGAAIGAVLVTSMDDAIKRVDTLNNAPKVLKNLGFSAKQAGTAMKTIDKGIEGLPTTLDSITGSLISITSASGKSLEYSTKLTLAFNNMALAGGKGGQEAERAMVQFTQALGRGKMGMQEFNTLAEVMPAQLAQVAKSLLGNSANASTLRDALSNGTITMDQFTDAIINLNKEGGKNFASFEQQAKDATNGIGTAWQNVKTAVVRGLANILNAIGQENIANALNKIKDSINFVSTAIIGFFDVIKGKSTDANKVFVQFKDTITNIKILVGIAVESIKAFFGSMYEKIKEGWNSIYPSLKQFWEVIQKELLPSITELYQTVAPILIPVLKVLGAVIGGTVVAAVLILIKVMTIGAKISSFLYSGIAKLIAILRAIITPIVSVGNMMTRMFIDTIKKVIGWIGNLIRKFYFTDQIKSALSGVYNAITAPFRKAFGYILGAIDTVQSAINGLSGGNINSVAKTVAGAAAKITNRASGTDFFMPRYASGTNSARGGMALVGERGPELVSLPRGSKVYRNDETQKMMGGNTTINISVNAGAYMGSQIDARVYARKILEALSEVAGMKGVTLTEMIART